MRPAAAGREILFLLEEGWTLKRGNFSGDWWLESGSDAPPLREFRKARLASARALLKRGLIKQTGRDFHRGDTYALTSNDARAAIAAAKGEGT